MPTLNESLFLTGLRCHKALWLRAKPPEKKSNFKTGSEFYSCEEKTISKEIKKSYPSGISCKIGENFEINSLETKELAHRESSKILYDACAQFEGITASCDALIPDPSRIGFWSLIKVQAATRPMRRHIHELTMICHVFQNSGINISQASIALINPNYTKDNNKNPEELFIIHDVTYQISTFTNQILEVLNNQQEILSRSTQPQIDIGSQCLIPTPCPFMDHCWGSSSPQERANAINGLAWKTIKPAIKGGHIQLNDLPQSTPLRIPKKSILESDRIKAPIINKEALTKQLKTLIYPIHFLDFETIAPAIPIFPNTSPFQSIPSQASLRITNNLSDKSKHKQFIANGQKDPRLNLAEFLIKHIGTEGSIMAYNAKFEKSVLVDLANHIPSLRQALIDMTSRLWDLYAPFQKGYYIHPDFKASFSLKAIAPVLAPAINYKSLIIQNGFQASTELLNLFTGDLSKSQKNQSTKDLKAYCATDTLAMMEILRHLNQITKSS